MKTYLIKRGGTPPSWMWLSVLPNVPESHHGGDVVVHRRGVVSVLVLQWRGPGSIFVVVLGVVHVLLAYSGC